MQSLTTLLGLTLVFGLFWAMQRAASRLWRSLAAVYRTEKSTLPERLAKKFPEQVVLFQGPLSFQKHIPLTIGIHADGISLVPPLAVFCPPLFLPFAEMSVKPTSWHLNAECYAVTMSRASKIEIILDEPLLKWIRAHCEGSPFHDIQG